MRKLGLVVAAWLTLLPVGALAVTYTCDFPRQRSGDWISPRIVLKVDGGRATVSDALITGLTGGPIEATIATENDRRITVRWRITDRRGRRADYTMTVIKARSEADAQMTLPSGVGRESASFRRGARGACVIA